jgi:hypothetical protein
MRPLSKSTGFGPTDCGSFRSWLNFDVFENPNAKSRKSTPLIVVLQHEASTEASTAIAAPLAGKIDVPANDRIVVPVEIDGQRLVILFRSMAAISRPDRQTSARNRLSVSRNVIVSDQTKLPLDDSG